MSHFLANQILVSVLTIELTRFVIDPRSHFGKPIRSKMAAEIIHDYAVYSQHLTNVQAKLTNGLEDSDRYGLY